ncbi:hypothetical protein KCF3NO3_34610 [Chryseobacterium sp. KCF3-3]
MNDRIDNKKDLVIFFKKWAGNKTQSPKTYEKKLWMREEKTSETFTQLSQNINCI